MKKLACAAIVYLLTINLSSGQTQNKTIGKKRTIYVDQNIGVEVNAKPAEETPYFGYDNKIKSISLNGTIPSGFPTKEGYSNKEAYRIAINKWIKENPSFVNPNSKNIEITD